MYGLATHNKPRLARLASGFQNNPTGLNNSQEFCPTVCLRVTVTREHTVGHPSAIEGQTANSLSP